METLKVQPTDAESQGDYVVICKSDFDKGKHKLFSGEGGQPEKEPEKPSDKKTTASKK